MTKVLMLGPTGAGKGTQAAALASFCDVPRISTGDIFRANIQTETPMGLYAADALRASTSSPTWKAAGSGSGR
jgi:adenylate kinase